MYGIGPTIDTRRRDAQASYDFVEMNERISLTECPPNTFRPVFCLLLRTMGSYHRQSLLASRPIHFAMQSHPFTPLTPDSTANASPAVTWQGPSHRSDSREQVDRDSSEAWPAKAGTGCTPVAGLADLFHPSHDCPETQTTLIMHQLVCDVVG